MHILLGIMIIAVGLVFVVKTEWFLRTFGRIGWFEAHLGTEGGSRLGYKLIGLLLCFLGMIIATNMIGGFLETILSPLLKYY